MIADVEPGAGSGAVLGRRDHHRRVAGVASPIERGDDECARTVDLDRAVVGAERRHHDGRRGVVGRAQGSATDCALVRLRVRALGHRDGAEVVGRLAGLGEEALGPHRHVHEVRVVADRVAPRRARTVERHGADREPERPFIAR